MFCCHAPRFKPTQHTYWQEKSDFSIFKQVIYKSWKTSLWLSSLVCPSLSRRTFCPLPTMYIYSQKREEKNKIVQTAIKGQSRRGGRKSRTTAKSQLSVAEILTLGPWVTLKPGFSHSMGKIQHLLPINQQKGEKFELDQTKTHVKQPNTKWRS